MPEGFEIEGLKSKIPYHSVGGIARPYGTSIAGPRSGIPVRSQASRARSCAGGVNRGRDGALAHRYPWGKREEARMPPGPAVSDEGDIPFGGESSSTSLSSRYRTRGKRGSTTTSPSYRIASTGSPPSARPDERAGENPRGMSPASRKRRPFPGTTDGPCRQVSRRIRHRGTRSTLRMRTR